MDTTADTNPQALFEAMAAAIRAQVLAENANKDRRDGSRLLTVKKAAEYLGRTESAVRQLIHRRVLPVVRFDRAVRIDVRDLDRLIEEHRT